MAVAVSAATLRTLHRIHRQLADLRDRQTAGPRKVAAGTRQLEAAEARKAAAQDDVKKARMAADQKQLQLKSAEVKHRDLEGKLNACKTNREYQALKEQLEALERIDALKPTVPAAEKEVEETRKMLASATAAVEAEAGRLADEVARVRGELETVERDLPADVRDRYERIVKQKGADGLAAVEGQSCGGCFQSLTGNMLSDLLMGRIIVCRSCGRLLYSPESSAPA